MLTRSPSMHCPSPVTPPSTPHCTPFLNHLLSKNWAFVSLTPARSLYNSAILAIPVSGRSLSLSLLSWSPSPSVLPWSSLVCWPCSAWALPSACFLHYIYSKNLHTLRTAGIKSTTTSGPCVTCVKSLIRKWS